MFVRAWRAVAIMCLFGVTGCDDRSPSVPSAPIDVPFMTAPGETTAIKDTSIRIRFVGVSSDSRCPADALCIQAGDALVRIEVLSAGRGAKGYDLHTSDMRPVVDDGLTIRLVQLEPYPLAGRTIARNEYRATLRVSRQAANLSRPSRLVEIPGSAD
jgi:hypothetical protein